MSKVKGMRKGKVKKNNHLCFAYKNNDCEVLMVNRCERDSCSFFKTKKQYSQDREKAMKRILSLDEVVQEYILDTYYKYNK